MVSYHFFKPLRSSRRSYTPLHSARELRTALAPRQPATASNSAETMVIQNSSAEPSTLTTRREHGRRHHASTVSEHAGFVQEEFRNLDTYVSGSGAGLKASGRYTLALGRLKDGVTLEQALTEMTAIAGTAGADLCGIQRRMAREPRTVAHRASSRGRGNPPDCARIRQTTGDRDSHGSRSRSPAHLSTATYGIDTALRDRCDRWARTSGTRHPLLLSLSPKDLPRTAEYPA